MAGRPLSKIDRRTKAGQKKLAQRAKNQARYQEKKAAKMRKIRNGRAKRGARGGTTSGLG